MHCFVVLEARFEMDAVGPHVDVALGRQIALAPQRMIVLPDLLQAADRRRRQPCGILAEQGRKRIGKVAARDALQIEDRQQCLDRLRAPGIGRQDRRAEAHAAGIVGRRPAVAHTRLAHRQRTDAG
jgi:hypothetical protein